MHLPHDPDAEQAVLGALMLEPNPVDEVEAYTLPVEAFFAKAHRSVVEACKALHDEGAGVDERTVADRMRGLGTLAGAGGSAYLGKLTESVLTTVNLTHYVRIVRDCWRRRSVHNAAAVAAAIALDDAKSADEALDAAGAVLTAAQNQQVVTRAVSMRDLLVEEYKLIEARRNGEVVDRGVPTGFLDLDETTGGFQPGNLVIVGGRPGMGKTAFVVQAAIHAATQAERRVLLCELEMTRNELTHRALSSRARVNLTRLRRPKTLASSDWPKLARASGELSTDRLHIDDQAVTLNEIRAAARLAKLQGGLDLLAIDYVQLIKPAVREQSREREVSEISRSLKALAKELDVPVVALAQLNRKLEDRTEKRPRLPDLRESGSLEQDADLVLFVHQPSEYDDKADDHVAELIVAKQRNGPTGIIEVRWDQEFASFGNLARRNEP